MTLNWTDNHLVALEMASARPAVARMGAMLAAVVEDKLAPAMANQKVHSCLHVMGEVYGRVRPGRRAASQRQVYICPQHPDRLLCDAPATEHGWSGCVTSHYAHEHHDEHETGACFVCKARLRDSFTPVVAEVQLHRPVPLYDDNRGRNAYSTYSGTLVTLPVTYLCPIHAGLVELPLRMTWPTDASDAIPEDVTRG